jgi:hypothetical protein
VNPGSEAIIEVAEEPIADLARLRQVAPPPALVARVMTRLAQPTTPTPWQWLVHPVRIELRISPLGMLALGVFLAIAMAFVVAR